MMFRTVQNLPLAFSQPYPPSVSQAQVESHLTNIQSEIASNKPGQTEGVGGNDAGSGRDTRPEDGDGGGADSQSEYDDLSDSNSCSESDYSIEMDPVQGYTIPSLDDFL